MSQRTRTTLRALLAVAAMIATVSVVARRPIARPAVPPGTTPESTAPTCLLDHTAPDVLVRSLLGCFRNQQRSPGAAVNDAEAAAIRGAVDEATVIKRVSGAAARSASAADAMRLGSIIATVFERAFAKALRRMASQPDPSFDVRYDSSMEKANVAGSRPNGSTADFQIPVVFRARRSDTGDWKIYDLIQDNVGLVANYRYEIGTMVKSDGMSAALDRIEARLHRRETALAAEEPITRSDLEAAAHQPGADWGARAVPYFRGGRSIGLRFFAIKAGSVWVRAGLENGDILLSVNGAPLSTTEDLTKVLIPLPELRTMKLAIERDGEPLELEPALAEGQ